MSSLQLTVALLCLFGLLGLTCAAFDPHTAVKILRDVDVLKKEKQDLVKKYKSSHDFTSKVLDRALDLVERIDEMMQEYEIEEEFSSVAEFVEDLKTILENTKVFTKQQMDTMEEEFDDKTEKINALLMKVLQ